MADNSLIDKYLPHFSFNEYHEILINNSIENVYHSAKNVDLSKSKRISLLFKLRGLPTKRLRLQEFITDIGFTNLEENYPTENLIGFWVKTRILPISSYEDFIQDAVSPRVKGVWNFHLEQLNSKQTRLSTETRVLCVSRLSKITFGLYWFIIKPFSGLVRKEMLSIVKNDSESSGGQIE